jgi:hypothetical protein
LPYAGRTGSIVRHGELDARVYATGANTDFGETVQRVQEAHTVSRFQHADPRHPDRGLRPVHDAAGLEPTLFVRGYAPA